jgi:hypothetical protein
VSHLAGRPADGQAWICPTIGPHPCARPIEYWHAHLLDAHQHIRIGGDRREKQRM